MTLPERHYAIGVIDVCVRSNCRGVLREYDSLYAPYRSSATTSRDVDVAILARRRIPLTRGPYTLRGNGSPEVEVRRRHEVLPHLEWYINWQIIHTCHEYIQLHASSIERDGLALILPGDPGAGKTTLTAGLLARGWSYLCDEFALIDASTRRVHPYPRALCVKEPSFQIVERLGLPLRRKKPYQKPTKGRVAFLNPRDCGRDRIGTTSPIRWVVFPRYVRGASPVLRPLPRSQAAHKMAKQCFNIRADQVRALQILADVARRADCYELVAGDIHATCDLVESLPMSQTPRKAG
jgi:HprK-related kinase A